MAVKKTKKRKVIQDTRERLPWDFSNDKDFDGVEITKLEAGDYSLKGLEDRIAIERKYDANELLNNFTKHKDRFYREMDRLYEYDFAAIVIEQEFSDIINTDSYFVNQKGRSIYKSPAAPVSIVLNNLLDIMVKYNIHVVFAGDSAKKVCKSLLLKASKNIDKNDA